MSEAPQNQEKVAPNHKKSGLGDPPGCPEGPRTKIDGKLSKKCIRVSPPRGTVWGHFATLGAFGPTFSPFLGVRSVVGAPIAVLIQPSELHLKQQQQQQQQQQPGLLEMGAVSGYDLFLFQVYSCLRSLFTLSSTSVGLILHLLCYRFCVLPY